MWPIKKLRKTCERSFGSCPTKKKKRDLGKRDKVRDSVLFVFSFLLHSMRIESNEQQTYTQCVFTCSYLCTVAKDNG